MNRGVTTFEVTLDMFVFSDKRLVLLNPRPEEVCSRKGLRELVERCAQYFLDEDPRPLGQ